MLAPIGPGQSISVTDDGWRTDIDPNAFGGSALESHHTYTASANTLAGAVLSRADFAGTSAFQLNFEGDQLIVYQGTKINPTFLCALDYAGGHTTPNCPGSVGGWHQAACNSELSTQFYSALPAGLADGVDALAFPKYRFLSYAGITSGSP
eukprot:4092591-Prymnesium_polylepis.1